MIENNPNLRPILDRSSEEQSSVNYPEKSDEQKEKDAESFIKIFIWIIGIILGIISLMAFIGENSKCGPDDSLLWLYFGMIVLSIGSIFFNLSILRIASGIARNLREINRKLK